MSVGPNDEVPFLRGVICATDAMVRDTVAGAVVRAGVQVEAEVDVGPDLVTVVTAVRPELVIIDNDIRSGPGMQWVPDVRELVPRAAILMIANDPSIRESAHAAGIFGVVFKTQLSELDGALGRAIRWVSDVDRKPFERRGGTDRRHHQDWSKVTHERRTHSDRRDRDLGPPPGPPQG